MRGSASSFPRRSVVIATRRVRPPGAAWNYSAPWTSRSTGGATHRQSQGTSSKTIARNILLWTPKCDWSEDLTTEFILLRGSRLQILVSAEELACRFVHLVRARNEKAVQIVILRVRGIASQRATIDENIILPTSKGAAGTY